MASPVNTSKSLMKQNKQDPAKHKNHSATPSKSQANPIKQDAKSKGSSTPVSKSLLKQTRQNLPRRKFKYSPSFGGRSPIQFILTGASILLLVFGLNLARVCCQAALNPLFGSVGASLYFDNTLRLIDLFIVPTLNAVFARQAPSLGASALLAAFLVWRTPDTFGRLIRELIGDHYTSLGAPLGSMVFQTFSYWPIRTIGMCAAQMAVSQFNDKNDSKVLRPRAVDTTAQAVWGIILSPALHGLSLLTLPYAKSFLDEFVACEMSASATTILLSIATFTTLSQLLDSSQRIFRKINGLIVIGCILGTYVLPSPMSMCFDPRRPIESRGAWPHKVLARRLSVTGLILVGEFKWGESNSEFRYLRCDHSLLGGIWIGPAKTQVRKRLRQVRSESTITEAEIELRATKEAESIYPTFHLQEAIRLSERPSQSSTQALIIGLGIGISARSLMRHGVKVTIVEIDPLVYEYAQKYFALPTPAGGIFLEDARAYLRRKSQSSELFDYVIHDVFTGGSVPPSLFTVECWLDVRSRLKDDGILAVNFAGEPKAEAGSLVLNTLFYVFPHCRAFAEKSDKPTSEEDFQNMVLFCSPSGPPKFRAPTKSDVFGSAHRFEILKTFNQLEFNLSVLAPDRSRNSSFILRDQQQSRLERAQTASAIHHWEVMKQVLPSSVWAGYY